MQPEKWLIAAGFVTWLASGVPGVLAISDGRLIGLDLVAWAAAFLAFGLAFTFACAKHVSVTGMRLLLLAQAIAGLSMVALTRDGFAAATLVVAAAQLLGPFTPAKAAAWVAAQTALLALIFGAFDGVAAGLTAGGAFVGFQVFALATSGLALRERAAREDLSRANAELHATRALLAENSRVAERLRISRDLHDTVGHHLTALSLQLEVASRLASGPVADRVSEAHAITRLLLSDVRDVVSRLRESSRFDLAEAIRTLAGSSRALDIHVEISDGIAVEDPLQVHALLRCVQEVITNTARHGHAHQLWITLQREGDGLALTARDDGRGSDEVAWGNGLRGMRERFEELSGRVEFSSRSGGGFEVRAFMPVERGGPFGSAAEISS
jgi:signal transduction histidine kinase